MKSKGKEFFEVFDTIDVDSNLRVLFSETVITGVTVSESEKEYKINLLSGIIIEKEYISKMERELKKQLFSKSPYSVKISEKFDLSFDYDIEKIWKAYEKSIALEVSGIGSLIHIFLKEAQLKVEGNVITVSAKDSFLNKKLADMLKIYLEGVFTDRFNIAPDVRFDFIPYKEESVDADDISLMYEAPVEVKGYKNKEYYEENQEPVKEKTEADKIAVKAAEESAAAKTNDNKGSEKKAYEKGKSMWKKKLPDDPDIFYGRAFEGDVVPIEEIQDEIGEAVIKGQIIKNEMTVTKNGRKIFTFAISDFTDSITGKIFFREDSEEEEEAATKGLKAGSFVMLKGVVRYDTYAREITISGIQGIKSISDFRAKRMDNSELKRVELHAHTKMSDMDAVIEAKDLIKTAYKWGHKAVAITDHGVVQAFTEANHTLSKDEAKNFKIIYGCEGYLVDDLKEIVKNAKGQELSALTVVFDIETTGFSSKNDRIIEIGAVKIVNGETVDTFSTFVNPEITIPYEITNLTSITDEMVADAPLIEEALKNFLAFSEGCILVAHNATFDTGFIAAKSADYGYPYDFTVIDTLGLSRALLPHLSKFKLDNVARALNVSLENHHRAVDDAGCTAEIYKILLKRMAERGITTAEGIRELEKLPADSVKKLPYYHVIILCKNEIGRVNLYKLVSKSHIDYFYKRPRIPKSLLHECREGLIIGSACEAGELYKAFLNEASQEEISQLARFYDYYEIQPLGNNYFMIEDDNCRIRDIDDLKDINREIVKLGEKFHKPVVATCDCHFLNPEDEIYRRIIMAGQGFKDADKQAPLYFRTTEEMLAEFEYLGSDKAKEVVITNTNLIADSIDKISPVRPDKCPPVIEDSDKTLRQICYDKAHSMYGPELPTVVSERLEKELNSIISNGFAVMYIIAQKLVWKSNDDGYLVGSRGSVGSSFVATMAGITEVNPLVAHYYCSNCYYSDFDSEEVKQYAAKSGCDMPDKICPKCGQPLNKEGHNIPFETFLGFYGDKEPDIDLNFSGEYQSHAHDYTEVLFGTGYTFRAGTIGTLADKTAFGFVKKYYEERGINKRDAEIERIAAGCVGIRRTTGQHPGGIVVMPHGEEIYSFTPVQRPANDMTTKTVTTHFDYHSIDHNLLKLDILGHDDPTMIRMLEDLTGIDAKTIRLDDKQITSLFSGTEALGITPADIDGTDLGSLGMPELGTHFVMQMLRETKPQCFSDMIRISGLSHGTDVWTNNTQELIKQERCTLSTAICTRDDIMTYLISMGVENGLSFKIMESVRKGKGLTPDMEKAMVEKNVPDWYIWSCKQIKYMFPKAHACAYVMMAYRIGYFKINYPLAYYAAYFSIRADAFNYEKMCLGKERLVAEMNVYKKKASSNDFKDKPTKKEDDEFYVMRLVQEMYARGLDFMPIDIYRAKASRFQIIDGKLMPSFNSIDGLGEKAAEQIVEAAAAGEKFLSLEDFRLRTKVSSTVVDTMAELGLMGSIPKSNQMSLEDLFG